MQPIERDEDYDRTYYPLPGGWEVQTKGNGSTFRVCDTKTGDRWPVLDAYLHDALERMAKDIRSAIDPRQMDKEGDDDGPLGHSEAAKQKRVERGRRHSGALSRLSNTEDR